ASSFGDDRVLIEKYILSPRHIEVQVFGDSHGNVVHLFERDCSLQRRHQKVIEEAPAPGMDEATREAVCGAAVRAAQAVNYENAGTIEFIADASEGLRADRIWFMEMNTRLQVEHPVTEEITGQDLVEWQLRVASGEKLPKKQDELSITGHAIEARLYAEDPAKGFLPSVGKLIAFQLPRGLRVETGVEHGDEISPFYDPMVAKLIAVSEDREAAKTVLENGCERVLTWPVQSNAGFLAALLQRAEFVDGKFDTSFIAEHLKELTERPEPEFDILATAAGMLVEGFRFGFRVASGRFLSAPLQASGLRLNAPVNRRVRLAEGSRVFEIEIADSLPRSRASSVQGEESGPIFAGTGLGLAVVDRGWTYHFTLPQPRGTGASHGSHDGEIEAPMPGKVTAVEVAAGDKVAKGQRLLTLEAMKMEHALTAPFDGTVAELNARPGDQVSEGQLLVKLEPAEE
ncbi:MAG: biotin/lipoyl-containing protein, partial [Sphingomicrobium sp.]